MLVQSEKIKIEPNWSACVLCNKLVNLHKEHYEIDIGAVHVECWNKAGGN